MNIQFYSSFYDPVIKCFILDSDHGLFVVYERDVGDIGNPISIYKAKRFKADYQNLRSRIAFTNIQLLDSMSHL